MTCHQPVGQTDDVRCTPYLTPSTPMSPQCPPHRAVWWPTMLLTSVQLISAHVLLSAIDHLEFSRVLCNSPSSYFICNPPISPNTPYTPASPQCPLIPLHPCWPLMHPWHPLPAPGAPYTPVGPWRHLVTKSSTTWGQLDIWSAFWSGWPVYFGYIWCQQPG